MAEKVIWKDPKQPIQERIEHYCKQYEPKEVNSYMENGVTIKVYETRRAAE